MPHGCRFLPRPGKAAMLDKMKNKHDDRGDKDQMNQGADDAGKKTADPKDGEKDCDSNEHGEKETSF